MTNLIEALRELAQCKTRREGVGILREAAQRMDAREKELEQLRDLLAGYKEARIVVSYYDSPRIRELYEGWTFVEHYRVKHLHAQNGRGSKPKAAPEVLILNGPSLAARRNGRLF